jgi:hypothetical protein
MGALYLKPLDDRMAQLGVVYVRYDRYLHHWGQWVRAGLSQRLLTDPLGLTVRMGQGYFKYVVVCGTEYCYDLRNGTQSESSR